MIMTSQYETVCTLRHVNGKGNLTAEDSELNEHMRTGSLQSRPIMWRRHISLSLLSDVRKWNWEADRQGKQPRRSVLREWRPLQLEFLPQVTILSLWASFRGGTRGRNWPYLLIRSLDFVFFGSCFASNFVVLRFVRCCCFFFRRFL